jgi:predicted DNA-binding transcriptional regulator YafY
MNTDDKAQRIVIRANAPYMNYVRTLPLHHSQKEIKTTDQYADFEFYLKPTFDFRQELLAQGHDVEVLLPAQLREEMKEMLEKMLGRYQ